MTKTRVHYVPGCENTSGDDTLALTGAEAIAKVNCSECIHEMYEVGLLVDNG